MGLLAQTRGDEDALWRRLSVCSAETRLGVGGHRHECRCCTQECARHEAPSTECYHERGD
jgi:hypothetical protein